MNKYFSLMVLLLGAPLAVGATVAMFYNPVHIFTALVLWSAVIGSLYEPDEDSENLITALRRVFCRRVGGEL